MAEEDINTLCLHMRHLSLDQVRSLEDDKVIPGLRLGDVQDSKEARDKVCAALKSGESRLVRLRKLAEAYCWLFARSQRLTWALFALDRSMPPVHDFTLQTLIATALTFPGVDIGYVTLTRGRERYACAITAQKQSDPEGAQIVVGMCAWQDLPYLAMCFPGTSCVARVQPLVDDILECKCDDIFLDCYTGIDQTLAQANIHRMQSASGIAGVLKSTLKL
ncbi:hypothetical protein HPB51_026965 [Rhipicephalus microplus]|uniref:Uncharacterized protein n=1 Tax=Rhipicephalus microplus TaxID=6941 RepID=A0A9J6D170_RHIMP|nr:hypothetical protein HPB51_026965 [Rhipicephalus microplus]